MITYILFERSRNADSNSDITFYVLQCTSAKRTLNIYMQQPIRKSSATA
jgi:hypothetical protein